MSTPDPFGDALNSQAQMATGNPDPYAAALEAHAASAVVPDSPKAEPTWKEKQMAVLQKGPDNPISGFLGKVASSPINPMNWAQGATEQAVKFQPAQTFKLPGGGSPQGQELLAAAQRNQPDVAKALTAAGGIYYGVKGLLSPNAATSEELANSVPPSQLEREAVLKRIGLSEARISALTGDASAAANDYQEAKLTNPNGLRMKQVIDNERQALASHADSITESTGGTPGSAMDEAIRAERGNNILKPLDDLKAHFDAQTKSLYDQASERAAGQPVALTKFQEILNDQSELTNSDRVHLVGGTQSYLKKLGMAGEDGSFNGAVTQAETIRKYLNENWSPQNSRLVGKLKDAIDDDVTQSAGSDIYAQARAMRTLRARTLDDPNGIAKIMDSSGPSGINRAIPVEKVADAVTRMPVAQLDHIVQTLKTLPPELQESGNAAIAELRAHVASQVSDAGQRTASLWNSKGVNQMLANNSQRLKILFEPDELAKFDDLNTAGNILKKDQSYPGAAVQEHNLVQRGAMGAIRSGSTLLGAQFGPLGAVAGEAVGTNLANRYSAASALKAVEARIKPLD